MIHMQRNKTRSYSKKCGVMKKIWSATLDRTSTDFEYELIDTGVFDDDRYFDVFVEYAKKTPNDLLISITVWNRGPEPASGQATRPDGPVRSPK